MDNRNNGGNSEQSVVHIPQEIIEIILPNLPVKSLLRFKSGSKSWRSLIESKTFIRKQLENSQRRAVVYNYCSFIYCEWKVPKSINDDRLTSRSVVGCCNGVICILKNGCFFLYNPATKIYLKLPTLELMARFDYDEIRCGFGWDEDTDAYKVFVYFNDGYGERSGHVYSSKTRSWKEVDWGRLYDSGGYRLYNVGVLACGKLHWVPQGAVGIRDSKNKYTEACIIEYFDLKSEAFGRIELPSEPERGVGRWWLRERDGCLEALYYRKDDDKRDRRHKVWLNKGYDNVRKERERKKKKKKKEKKTKKKR